MARASRFKGRVNVMGNGNKPYQPHFLSAGKDNETVIKKLFVDDKIYGEMLKRLLVINTPDCLTDLSNVEYIKKIQNTSIKDLREGGYFSFKPRFIQEEHETVKSRIITRYQQFSPSLKNEYYLDRIIEFDVLCHVDYWEMDNYQLRPVLIAGYIDSIMNNAKLTGLGTLKFQGASYLQASRDWAGYCMIYSSVHGNDDRIDDDGMIPIFEG